VSQSIDLLCVGLTTLDIAMHAVDSLPPIDTGVVTETILMSPAGTAAGAAMIGARLGLNVALASAVGPDLQGQAVRNALEAQGIDTGFLATDSAHPTSTTVIPVRDCGQRSTYHMVGASRYFEISDDLFAALPRVRAVHWGAVNLPGVVARGAAFLEAARAAGAFVTCDLVTPRPGTLEDLERILPHVDLFMPSLAEVEKIHGNDDLAAAAERFLALGARACVFKLGHEGAVLITADRTERIPAIPIRPVDTTTCGDSFCIGFQTARLRGFDEAAALRFATATAAQVAMGLGTTGALAGFEETAKLAALAPEAAAALLGN
jgi:sugar/nucleoside kinase (ribokinase family)